MNIIFNLLLDYINFLFLDCIFNYLSLSYLYFLFVYYLHVILSIWARAAGPRTRLDHIAKITWKQYIVKLIGMCAYVLFWLLIF